MKNSLALLFLGLMVASLQGVKEKAIVQFFQKSLYERFSLQEMKELREAIVERINLYEEKFNKRKFSYQPSLTIEDAKMLSLKVTKEINSRIELLQSIEKRLPDDSLFFEKEELEEMEMLRTELKKGFEKFLKMHENRSIFEYNVFNQWA